MMTCLAYGDCVFEWGKYLTYAVHSCSLVVLLKNSSILILPPGVCLELVEPAMSMKVSVPTAGLPVTSLCNDLLRYTQLRANASPSVNHRVTGELLNMVSQQGITFHVAEQSLEQERASG